MNKNTLVQKVKALKLTQGKYCVLAGGAMLFYGLREQTQDIDLHVDETAFMQLNQSQKLIVLDEERRHYAIGDDIELYVVASESIICEMRDGISVQTPQEILLFKKRLNRSKDAADIAALENYIAMNKNQ